MFSASTLCFVFCQRKVSPCPLVFTYDPEKDTSDTWYGTLKIETSVQLHHITVDVIFDKKAATFGVYHFNDVSTDDYIEYRVEKKNFKLDPGRTLVMTIYVRYTQYQAVPLLKQVRLNGQNVCMNVLSAAVQPIYPSSNSQSSTKQPTRREFPDNNYDGTSNDTTTYRSIQRITTQSWNEYENANSNKGSGREVYGSQSQFSGNKNPETSSSQGVLGVQRPSNINGGSSVVQYGSSGTNQQGREVFVGENSLTNQQGRGTSNQGSSTGGNAFVGDSYTKGSDSSTDYFYTQRTTTQRPFTQRTTTSNYGYNNYDRTTASTYRPSNINGPSRGQSTIGTGYFQGDLHFISGDEPSTHSILNLDDESVCGSVIPKVNPLIVHGEETYQGQFPWHAALYVSAIGSLKYICGGSLVTMSAVITAAHCVTRSKTNRVINSDNLLVYLGKHNLQSWKGPEQDAKVSEIVVNEDFDPESFYADIAVLKLKQALTKTNFVRPVCLWDFDSDLKGIVNKLGSVPGWGYNENGQVSEDLSFVKMPVVTHETCIWSNRDFFSKVTSDKAFCAGFRNGTSVCNGDSGGGMVFRQAKQFYLRGIVSISIALQNSLKCDPSQYAVFVDVAKFTTWIKRNI